MQKVKNQKTLVIKIGSSGVASPEGDINFVRLEKIVADIAKLIQQGFKPLLVSSGAILAGRKHLNIPTDKNMKHLQALSSLGQPLLMQAYAQLFKSHGLQCAQVLLTHEDFSDKRRYLNVRNTLMTLLENNIIPIINENDVVSFHEITVGDNDQLAAMTTHLLSASSLLILTGPKGLYDKDPEHPDARLIREVTYGESREKVRLKGKSAPGRGGMASKLDAIKRLTTIGIPVRLTTFEGETPIFSAIFEHAGTSFLANPNHQHINKLGVLINTVKTGAILVVDEGAYRALQKGASLLPAGIKDVRGSFRRGDCVALKFSRHLFASGLTEYSAAETKKIMGKQVNEIANFLGHCPSKVVIHRNNFILKESP